MTVRARSIDAEYVLGSLLTGSVAAVAAEFRGQG